MLYTVTHFPADVRVTRRCIPEFGDEYVKIAARESPPEWLCGSLIAVLESHQAPAEGIEVYKIAGREQLTLGDRKVDLDFVQPTGVDWRMNHNDIGPFGSETISRPRPTMGRAIVGDKEHAARGTIGFLAHHLCDEAFERGDPSLALAPPE